LTFILSMFINNYLNLVVIPLLITPTSILFSSPFVYPYFEYHNSLYSPAGLCEKFTGIKEAGGKYTT